MKTLLVALTLVSLQTSTPKLLDKYNCKGTDPDGEYTTTLTIEQKGDNYFLAWPEVGSQGMGMRLENDLAVVFVTQRGGVGVALYKISDGQLGGFWAAGDGMVYAEICTAGILAKGEGDGPRDTPKSPRPSSVRAL